MVDWSWQYDWMLIGEEGDRPIVDGVNILRLDARGQPIAVHYKDGARTQRDAMELYGCTTIFAVGGGAPLARLITGGFPTFSRVRVLGLRKVSRVIVDDVAQSEYLPQVERLVLRASGIDDIGHLLASPLLERLPELVVFDAGLPALQAIAERPWPNLRELRLLGPYPAHPAELGAACAATFETLFATLRGRLRLLHVDRFVLPLDAMVASPACEGLEELGVERCELRGGELLGALRELRELRASHSSLDDDAAMAIARCPRLETLQATATRIGDPGVVAIASAALPALRDLDLRDTCVTDEGVLALIRTDTLPGLAQLRLSPTLGWRTVLAGRRSKIPTVRDAVRASLPVLERWRPPLPAPASGTEAIATALWRLDAQMAYHQAILRGWWPAPPPQIARRFVFETIKHCGNCGGTGSSPEGVCGYHVDSQVWPRHDEHHPHASSVVIAIARTAERFARAESLALALVRALGIRVDTLVWHVFDEAWFDHANVGQPPATFATLAPYGDYFVNTPLWPHVAVEVAEARAQTAEERAAIARSPIGIAAAFTDLGYWFHSVEGRSLHLVTHGSVRDEP